MKIAASWESGDRRSFLEELAYNNPRPQEEWMKRENWDPMFTLAIIDAAVSAGYVETIGDRRTPDFSYRFTPKGRDALEQIQSTDPENS